MYTRSANDYLPFFFGSHTILHPTARLNKIYTIYGVLSMAMNLMYNTRTGKNQSQFFTNEYLQRIKNKPSANLRYSGMSRCMQG